MHGVGFSGKRYQSCCHSATASVGHGGNMVRRFLGQHPWERQGTPTAGVTTGWRTQARRQPHLRL
eukprot:10923306-Prorocentrum_lima.AAC.1